MSNENKTFADAISATLNAALFAIAFAALGSIVAIAFHLHAIERELNRANSFYLCVETWKLGSNASLCDDLISNSDGSPKGGDT